ncbi:MAG: hypothetical protein AAF975_05390, partial [Spirochaetota bacterium]
MRRKCFAACRLLLLLWGQSWFSPVFAQPLPKPFYGDISGSYVNDYYTGGAVMNTDDRYTFGFRFSGALNNWNFLADYRSFTDRYRSGDRFDELRLGLQFLWGNFLDADFLQVPTKPARRHAGEGRTATWYMGIGPQLRYLSAGQLAGETLQNLFHRTIRVAEVFLPYPYPPLHGLELGGDLYFSYLWAFGKATKRLRDSSLELGTFVAEHLALGILGILGGKPGVLSHNFVWALLLRLSSNSHFIELKPSLEQRLYFGDYNRGSARLWGDTETSFGLNIAYRAGFYQRSWDIDFNSFSNPALSSGHGRGSLTLSFASLSRKKPFVEPDFSTSLPLGPLDKQIQ